jgi:hypothetical protein
MQPSENEDFDAVSTGTPTPATSFDVQPPATPTAPAPVTVAEPEAPATVEAPAATEEPAAPVTPAEDVMPPKPPKEHKPFPKVAGLTALVVVLVLAVAGLGVYASGLSSKNKQLESKVAKLNANPQLLVQKQTDDLIATVGKLMTLPKNETPTVANVSDAAKAKQQSAFFNNAQNGDRVLMYVKAGEAILYRPATGKIILVAPLTFNNSTAATTSSTTTSTPTTTKK